MYMYVQSFQQIWSLHNSMLQHNEKEKNIQKYDFKASHYKIFLAKYFGEVAFWKALYSYNVLYYQLMAKHDYKNKMDQLLEPSTHRKLNEDPTVN